MIFLLVVFLLCASNLNYICVDSNMQTPCIIFVEQHFNLLLLELVKFQNVVCSGNKLSSGHLFGPSKVGNDMNFIVKQEGGKSKVLEVLTLFCVA